MEKSEKYIRDLIRQGEHQRLDFKYAITDSRKIARSLVAFANSEGGTLLIGVRDNGSLAGVRSEEEIYMIETAAILWCRPEVSFTTQVHEIDNTTILEVIVPPSEKRPYLAPDDHDRWHAYVRVGDRNRIANKVLVRSWKRKTRRRGTWVEYTKAEKILLDYLSGSEMISQSTFRKIARIPYPTAGNILVNFLAWEIIEPVFTDQGIRYKLKVHSS